MTDPELLKKVKEKAGQWLDKGYDEETRKEVQRMLDDDEEALVEAFYSDLEFGTGGLRGIMGPGTNRVNRYTIGMATQGLANYLKKNYPAGTRLKAAVTHDSRNNSRLFAETTAAVLSANDIEVYLTTALRPTPELSFAIRHLGCHSGVVVTASHNPKEYNGYKVYWSDGGQVVPPHDKGIIAEVQAIRSIQEVKFEAIPSLIHLLGDELDIAYTDRILKLSQNPEVIKDHGDIKIVYTPIHGTGVRLVPMALERMGFTSIIHVDEQDISDGNFPTVYSPNPEEKAALDMALMKARETGADLVMATDPDADRVGIAVKGHDGEFILLNGNQTGALLTWYLLKEWKRKGKITGVEYIARTIVTTSLLDEIATSFGVKTYHVLTGFKYIAELIREKESKEVFICGGEESYGFMLGDFVRDKDAVSCCALIAETAAWAKSEGMSLLDLLEKIYHDYALYHEHLISIVRKGKSGQEEIAAMMERFRSNPPESLAGCDVVMIHDFLIQKSYDQISHLRYDITLPKSNVLQFVTADGTVVSARPSGTEPKIKFYFSVRQKIGVEGDLESTRNILKEKVNTMIRELGLV